MKLIDRFTTQHGSWDVNPANRWGIDQAHRDKYQAGSLIDGAGADHHIFVHASPALLVEVSSNGNDWFEGDFKGGWWSFPIYDAYFDPDKGERGPWRIMVDDVQIADGIGMPKGEHVSWFFVVEDTTGKPDISTPPTQPPSAPRIQLIVDGVVVWQS